MQLFHQPSLFFDRSTFGRPSEPFPRLTLYWLVFSISVSASITDMLTNGQLPFINTALHVAGLVPCGFAWLFARSLFRERDPTERWPELIVATLFLSCLVVFIDDGSSSTGLVGYIAQLRAFLGSTMLLMTFVEVCNSRHKHPAEQRFRLTFGIVHVSLISISFAFVLPELSAWQNVAFSVLASVALIGCTLAWRYRLRNPLPGMRRKNDTALKPLAVSLKQLLDDHKIYLDPAIKVSSLAEQLGQPDYKISRCIVDELGYPNFNQLVNQYRVDEAKRQLSLPTRQNRPILTIAMECGFGSLGPFNRAFKLQTGMTPTAYRKAACLEK
ncbi:MAG: helix-turn-helix domain-containing protein [Woeseiaceae bacterium]